MLAKKKRWRWCLVQIFSWLPMGPEHKEEERLSAALFFLLSWYYSLLLFRTKPHFSERDIMVWLQSVINHWRQKYLTLVYLHESLQQQYLLSKIQKDNFFWRKFVLYLCRTNASFFCQEPDKANEVSILDLKTISIVSHAKEIGSPIPGWKMKITKRLPKCYFARHSDNVTTLPTYAHNCKKEGQYYLKDKGWESSSLG